MDFDYWEEPLDADAPVGKKYSFCFEFKPGDGLATVSIEVVNASSTAVLATGSVLLTDADEWGVEAGSTTDWVANVTIRGNSAPVGWHFVRCRYTTLAGNGDDKTYAVRVTQN